MKVTKSTRVGKKWMATFKNGNTTHFGAAGMTDYTLSGDRDARDRYRVRHAKDLDTEDPRRAGFLSFFLLWGDSTDLQTNVNAYRRRFGDL